MSEQKNAPQVRCMTAMAIRPGGYGAPEEIMEFTLSGPSATTGYTIDGQLFRLWTPDEMRLFPLARLVSFHEIIADGRTGE